MVGLKILEIIKINRYQWIVLTIAIYLLLVIQGATQGLAHFLLLFGIAATLNRPFRHVVIISLILGLLSDFVSGLPDGVFLISIPAALYTLYFVSNSLSMDSGSIYMQALMITGSIFMFYLLSMLLMQVLGYNPLPALRGILLQFLFSIVFFYPIYIYYQWATRLASKAA
jgi:cell shape-determining protein MreD